MNEIKNLRKFVAPEYVFGNGAIKLVSRYARNFGTRKALIVTDPGIIKAGWTKVVREELENTKLKYVVFSDVSPNPRAEEVMNGAETFLRENCNVIIAVGGGSVIDCAKGIGIVSTNKKHILEFEGIDRISRPLPPLISIPTTAGTSADISQFDIIRDSNSKIKIAIISKTVIPDVSLIDPVTTTTMDSYLTACTGIDALVHAIEAYVSNANSYFTDIHAIEAIRLISDNLLKAIEEPLNLDVRTNMMLGSLQAGLAFSNASLGLTHAMSHSLGGYSDLPHGECNAILMAHAYNFNFSASSERYFKIGNVLGLTLDKLTKKERQKAIFEKLDELKTKSGVTATLSTIGIKSSDIPYLARHAIEDACIITNPKTANQRDVEVVYEEAF